MTILLWLYLLVLTPFLDFLSLELLRAQSVAIFSISLFPLGNCIQPYGFMYMQMNLTFVSWPLPLFMKSIFKKQLLVQRRQTGRQQVHENIINIINHQGNADQNHKKQSPHICWSDYYQKDKK